MSLHISSILPMRSVTDPLKPLDIPNEKQIHKEKLQNAAFNLYIGFIVSLLWNIVAVGALWLQGLEKTKTLFFAIAYLLVGAPAAYLSWYRALSLALTAEKALMFRRLNCFLGLHSSFCIFAAMGSVPGTGRSLTSLVPAIDLTLSDRDWVGIFYLIGFCFFILVYIFSVWLMQNVSIHYRLCGLIDPEFTNPSYSQKLQKLASITLMGFSMCLTQNIIAVMVLCFNAGDEEETKILFLAVSYLVIGHLAAYILWYRPLYDALRTENDSMFNRFFLFFLLHIGFCIFASVAPPVISRGRSLTGILTAIDVLSEDGSVGVFYFSGFVCFLLESVLSVWLLQRVYQYYHRRESSGDLEII